MWKTSHVHGLEDDIVAKIVMLPKVIYRFKAIPIKIPVDLFAEILKLILKFLCKRKGPRITKATWKKKNNTGEHFQILTLSTKQW